jgi:hypothetical protein
MVKFGLQCLLYFVFITSCFAAPIKQNDLPNVLKDWVPWVLHGQTQQLCPFHYAQFNHKQCQFPSKVQINIQSGGASFVQDWYVDFAQWVPLPGRADQWPTEVYVDGDLSPVISRNKQPYVFLEVGTHQVLGELTWSKQPKHISLPVETGLVSLNINGEKQDFVSVDNVGRLWLEQSHDSTAVTQNDSLSVHVQRYLLDQIPFQITTRIELNVSGREREIKLEGAVLKDFIAMNIDSPLPARLEKTGELRIQAKAGQWVINVKSRALEKLEVIDQQDYPAPWPQQEVWVFKSQPNVRQVALSGAIGIDPQNTRLPQHWKTLPAYLIEPKTQLQIAVKQRGSNEQISEQLSLKRTWWLDFDGQGYSLQDEITGQTRGRFRLPMNADIQLGRVEVNGRTQFITRMNHDQRQGVELRQGTLNLIADSRWLDNTHLPATGWDAKFEQVSAKLNIPPGWHLFSASGVDKVKGSWVSSWTLLDLFLLFIISASFYRLWGKAWGIVALLGMALLYHEQQAPVMVWLNVLIAVALLKVLPTGRFRQWMQRYFALSIVAIIVISLPFMVQQARQGIYPQLERANYKVSPTPHSQRMAKKELKSAPVLAEMDGLAEMPRSQVIQKSNELASYDAETQLQTGPGLPSWRWKTSHFSFSGPVTSDQQIDLWLLSPAQNQALSFIRIIVIIALLACVLGWRGRSIDMSHFASVMVVVMSASLLVPQSVMAQDIPDADKLEVLNQRLLAAPDCVPACAASSEMSLLINDDLLTIHQRLDTADKVLVPLPGHRKHWTPSTVLVNDEPADGLYRDKSGLLWLLLDKGIHQLVLTGQLVQQEKIQLMLPIKPKRFSSVVDDEWRVHGQTQDGRVSDLILQRVNATAIKETKLAPSRLPALVKVQRHLFFDQEWQVQTQVTRLTPADSVLSFDYPLLDNEVVTQSQAQIQNNKIRVQLPARQTTFSWRSVLIQTETVSLVATSSDDWVESWQLTWSPIWHIAWQGIPIVNSQNANDIVWQPWPGEQVNLSISRPKGEAGQTLTIDKAKLSVRPGQRLMDVTMSLSVRSSLGQNHTIELPQQSTLQQVIKDGSVLSSRLIDNKLVLPVTIGQQQFEVKWQQAVEKGNALFTPKVDLNLNSVNYEVEVHMPHDRWIIALGGPQLGPAVLMWGVLFVLILAVIPLSRLLVTPLSFSVWMLLLLGLTHVSLLTLLIVVGWLFALGIRARMTWNTNKVGFNFVQIALGFWTFVALASLFFAIQQGLLGQPDMQIVGNGSYHQYLHWYQDRSEPTLPQAWIISVPLFIYRGLMLLWALWLSFALLGWLRWGWQCFSHDGIWRHIDFKLPSKR